MMKQKHLLERLEELVDEYAHQLGKKTKRAPLPFKINEEDGTLEVTLKCKAKGIRNDGTTWEKSQLSLIAKVHLLNLMVLSGAVR